MNILRSLVFFLFFVLDTLLFASIGFLLGWFLPGNARFLIDTNWSRSTLWALKVICGLSHRVEGMENMPKQTCIIVSNHQSTWETIALASLITLPKVWVLKRELIFIPIFGWVMVHFKPIAINRKSGRKAVRQVIEEGQKRLQEGLSVIIFPEGTRVAPDEKRRFGMGAAMLAARSGYPLLPIAHNAGVFWKRRGIVKYPGVIDVRIGPLIQSQGLKASEINQRIEEWIETARKELPRERPESE
jgi:1-acyl-sn-glycerol-3-phosphate acyltransferase